MTNTTATQIRIEYQPQKIAARHVFDAQLAIRLGFGDDALNSLSVAYHALCTEESPDLSDAINDVWWSVAFSDQWEYGWTEDRKNEQINRPHTIQRKILESINNGTVR